MRWIKIFSDLIMGELHGYFIIYGSRMSAVNSIAMGEGRGGGGARLLNLARDHPCDSCKSGEFWGGVGLGVA